MKENEKRKCKENYAKKNKFDFIDGVMLNLRVGALPGVTRWILLAREQDKNKILMHTI